eukprot:6192232-Pleurochrysis_carterae.AAC.2
MCSNASKSWWRLRGPKARRVDRHSMATETLSVGERRALGSNAKRALEPQPLLVARSPSPQIQPCSVCLYPYRASCRATDTAPSARARGAPMREEQRAFGERAVRINESAHAHAVDQLHVPVRTRRRLRACARRFETRRLENISASRRSMRHVINIAGQGLQ